MKIAGKLEEIVLRYSFLKVVKFKLYYFSGDKVWNVLIASLIYPLLKIIEEAKKKHIC